MSEPLTDAEIDDFVGRFGDNTSAAEVLFYRMAAQAREANRLRAEVADADQRGYRQGVKAGHEQAAAIRRLRLPPPPKETDR